jgi:DNA-binding IclR family transcriptional regulator
MTEAGRGSYLKVVGKTFRVIQAMAEAKADVRLTDLSRQLPQPKASVYRILYTLSQLGYVRQDPQTETYQLTDRVGWNVRGDVKETLRAASLPWMEKLRARFEQTLSLGLLEQGGVLYVDILEGLGAIRMSAKPNTYAPLHATALGKSILAFLDPGEAERMLTAGPLRKYTDNTITSPSILLRQLSRIRKQGYALDNEENEKGGRCVGAPILDSGGKPFAAISVSGPTSHLRESQVRQIGRTLRRVTKTISARLGHPYRT